MAEEASSVPANAVLALDRFVSASSAQDAVESLEAIVAGLKSKEEPWEQVWILNNTEVVDHLTHLLQHGTLKNGDLPCGDEGINLVCQLYQTSLAKNSQALKEPQPGQLLESLLDVMDSSDRQIYTRVLALQVLEQLSRNHSSLASSQWLQAPNGLHRLADMLSLGVDNPVEEVVRNQALVVAHILAREAPISKVFLFAEVESKLLDLCRQQGGLTKGNSVVLDALKLMEEMLKHADSNLQDLVWQRPSVPAGLGHLIDLRGADQFLRPDEYKKKQKVETTATDSNDDDDLDSLLQSGDSQKEQSPKKEGQQDFFIPRLSSDEESIVENVIRILHLLLESEKLRPRIWKAHSGICNLVWELALVSPTNPPLCAMPSSAIQQKALELVAMKFNDLETMDRLNGMDRLLFLVCIGGANAQGYKKRLALSQAALSVLRKTLSTDRVHELLLHTLAPPPEDEGAPAGPTVVAKLWNTVVENLSTSDADQQGDEARSIFLSGALGGLSLLLCDEQSREMMTRIVPDSANPDIMLEALQNEKSAVVQWTLLRFLCEWIMETPLMVQKLLNSTASTNLAGMASDSKKDYAPLVHLLLGLAMEYLPGDEQDCGGWTRAGILQVVKKIGISKFTISLEGLKKVQDCDLPCYVSPLERIHWSKWYSQAVWIVRKRVVDELTGGEPSSESDGDEAEMSHSSTAVAGSNKHLQKLIAQQAKEMETLRQEVQNATIKITSQGHQLDTWKRRMESTPTELDGLLSEMTNKTANLEETISKLESKAKEGKTAHEEEVSTLNKQLTEVRQEVETSRAAEKEAIEGWERMEQELGALSQAYSSLEQDFQLEKSTHAAALAAAANTMAATPAGESVTQEQAHGEQSEQRSSSGGSLEVATLRAENDRLRNDARAADEWMKMAVDKMNEMGQNGASLQQETESLKAQIKNIENAESTNKAANAKVAGKRVLELQEQVTRLEAQLQEEKALRAVESGNTEQQLAHHENSQRKMKEQITSLESQLTAEQSSSQAFAADAKQAQEKYERQEEEMKKEIFALEATLNEERQPRPGPATDTNQLQASHDVIVQELRKQIFNLEAQLEQQTSQDIHESEPLAGFESRNGPSTDTKQLQANHDAIVYELRQEIFNLEAQLKYQTPPEIHKGEALAGEGPTASGATDEQLEVVRRELETSREHFDEDIYKKESRIRELEDRLKSGLGPYTMEDIRARDEEIEELRSANDSAQEWMAKAVEHHQMLATQVATLSEEKVTLAGKIDHLETKYSSSGSNTEAITTLQSQLQQKVELVEQVSSELAQYKGELTKMKEEQGAVEDAKQDLSIARDEIASLQEKVQQLESRTVETNGISPSSENEGLESSNAELRAQLDQFTTWAEEAQKKIAEILSEKQAHEITIKDLTESNARLARNGSVLNENVEAKETERSQLETIVMEKDELVAELQSEKEKLAAEIATLAQQAEEAESQIEILQAEKIAAAEKSLEDRKEEEKTFEQNKEFLDEKITSLEVAVNEELDEINGVGQSSTVEESGEIANLREELEAALATLAQDEDVVHQWEDRVAELESTIQSLESQIEEQEKEANDVVSQWQESYSEAEEKYAELEKEIETMRSGMEAPGGAQDDSTEDRVAELETTVRLLESQLREQEKEAHDAICQWQESYNAADERCAALETEMTTLRSGTETPGGVQSDAMQDRVLELESTVQSLESQLQEQEKEASDIVSQWEESYTAADERCSALENKLETARSEMESLVGLNMRNDTQERSSDLGSTIQSLESQLQEQEKEAQDVVAQWEESYAATDEKCLALEKELATVRSEMESSGGQSDRMQERISELETTVHSLESQLQQQEKESSDVVSQWQESCTAAEEKCTSLENELETVRSELESSGGQSDEMQSRISELESTVQSLESQLQQQARESSDVVSQWQESCTAAEEKCTSLENELETVRSELESSGGKSDEMQARILELENTVQSLGSQLHEQARESSDVVSQWQESCTAAEEKCSSLETELEKVQSEMEALKAYEADKTRDELAADKIQIQELEEKIKTLEEEIRVVNKEKEEQQELSTEALSSLEKEMSASNASREDLNLQLQRLEEKLTSVRRTLDEKTNELQEYNNNIEALEVSRQTLEQENIAMRQHLESNPPERASELAEQLQQSEHNLAAAQEALRNDEEVVKQWEERAAELESTVGELETQLQEQESEANVVISEWQRQSSELETQLTVLQDQLHTSNETLAVRDATIENLKGLDSDVSSQQKAWLEDIGRYEDKISTLEAELDVKTKSLSDLQNKAIEISSQQKAWLDDVGRYEEKISTLEAELDAKNKSLIDLQNEAAQSKSLELESRIAEYDQKVLTLEEVLAARNEALSDLQEAAQNDASESDARLTEYQAKISALEADIESKIAVMSDLKDDIVEKSESLTRQELEMESLGNEIAQQKKEIEDLEHEILSRTTEIEDLKQSSESSMIKTELVASRAENELLNEKLQSEQAGRKSEIEQFEEALAAESLKLKEARDEVEEIRKESEDVVNQWTTRVDELEGTVVEIEQRLHQQEEEANVAISSWESKTLELEKELETSTAELDSLKQRLADQENSNADSQATQNLEAETTRLTVVVGQLEDELREANSMIQTYVTNDAAEKATEFAASALREEIDELQRAIDGYKQHIVDEELAREVAELEIERLRDDIATLAALTNQDDSTEGIELRTVRAAEHLKKKERIEIESLRNSLYRALNDIDNAQTAEREAVNQLAKMQLATSIAEKDIVTAKSEIHFLTQALEESRLAEENRRASLEYRISSLEDDNDLLRRYHADELEEVRQELSQVTMEKDRSVHQVRELERCNAALVAAASKEDIYALDDQADLEHEIARLRVEHEHLLTVASDDKARAERKLREMLAAQMASIEADTILEHELRVNAEEMVVTLKVQVEELSKASHAVGNGNDTGISSTSASKQIASLQEALNQVTKEKKNLKQKLEREASKARTSIEKLTEECRHAQSELHKTMRENRYDQAVKTEASNLHFSPTRRRVPMTPETRDDVLMQPGLLDISMTSINAATFDRLQNFKEEMHEERKIYLELLSEHDDLLALLAQLDVEKNSLKDALVKVAGQAAVDEALTNALEQTFEEHGGVIKLADDSDDDFAAITDMQ